MSRRSTTHLAAICALTLVAFSLRAPSLDSQSLWRDEVDALCYSYEFPQLVAQALGDETTGGLATPCACPPLAASIRGTGVLERLASTLWAMVRHNGPLYYFLLRGWVALAGSSSFGMRYLSLLFGVACVPLAYVLGRRLFGACVGLLAAFLMAFSPYAAYYSQEVKMYTLVPALAVLAIYALRRASESGRWRWWLVQIVSTSLAFYCHIFAALLVPLQILLYACWWPQGRRHWRKALVSLASLTLPYLPLAVWQARSVFQVRETGFPAHSLGEMVEILQNGWSLGMLARGWPWGTLLMGGLAAWGLFGPLFTWAGGKWGWRDAQAWRSRVAIVCWLLLPLLAIWLISLWQPLFTDRYLIWCAPAYYLLVALGLASIWPLGLAYGDGARLPLGRWGATVLIGGLVLVSAVNLRVQAREPIKSDFRAAAAYVGERISPGELIVFQIPHSRYTFDYYFEAGDYTWAEGQYTNHRADDGSYLVSETQAYWQVRAMVAGFEGIWLVLSEESMWDERALTRTWLEANAALLEEAQFARVGVFHFSGVDAAAEW